MPHRAGRSRIISGARNLDPQGFACHELPPDTARAKAMGYPHAKVMAAEIEGWIAANLPVDRDD